LTLADALVVLGKTYKLDFSIDEGAFHREHRVGATRQLLVRTPIPAMQGVPLAEVLGEVFARVPVPAGATFIIDDQYIRVTTRRQAVEDGWISVRQLLYSSAYRVRFFLWTDIQRNGIHVVGLYGIDAARLLGAITYWSCVMSDNTKAIAD